EQTLRKHDGSGTISPAPFRVDPAEVAACHVSPRRLRRPRRGVRQTHRRATLASPRPKTQSWVGYTGFDGTSRATTSSTRPSTIASRAPASPVTEHPPFASAFWKDLRNLMFALFRQLGSIACPLPNDVE